MAKLTKKENEVMQHLWRLERCFMKDLVDQYEDPKPAYTTIATILSRMVSKGYVGFEQHGKVREYFPLLKKKAYFSEQLKNMIRTFFDGSAPKFASHFAAEADLSLEELEALKEVLEQRIEEKKQ